MNELIEIYTAFLGLCESKGRKLKLNQLVKLAERHSLAPIILRMSSQSDVSSAETELKKYLARHAMMIQEFKIVSDFLAKAHIETIFFKGIAIGANLYSNPILRPCRDIDILIRKENRGRALKILKEKGYFPKKPYTSCELKCELFSQPALEFYHEERKVLVDLHWSIGREVYGQSLSSANLFSRAEEVELYGKKVKTLSKQDTLLALAVNASRDHWQKLSFVGDMYLFLEKYPSVNIDEVLCDAKSNHVYQTLLVSIDFVRKVLEVPFLPEVHTTIESKAIALDAYQHLLELREYSELDELKLELKIRDRSVDKIKNIIARIFLPHDRDFQTKIPNAFFFLHFLIKPSKTILRAVRSCF